MPEADNRLRWTFLAVVLCWVYIAYSFFYNGLYFPLHSDALDFQVYWKAAREIVRGSSPFDENLFQHFHYPIFAGLIFAPLGMLSFDTAKIFFHFTNCLTAIGAAVVLSGILQEGVCPAAKGILNRIRSFVQHHRLTVSFLLVASHQSLIKVWTAGNVEPFALLLISLFLLFLVLGHEKLAAVFFAIVCLIKITPIFLLFPLAFMRRWKFLTGLAIAGFGYFLLLAVTGFWREELFLYREVLPGLSYVKIPVTVSIHRALNTLLFGDGLSAGGFSRLILVADAILFGIYLLTAVVWLRRPRRSAEAFLAYSFYVLLLLAPMLELYHFLWLLGALFLQLRAWLGGRMKNGAFLCCALLVIPMLNITSLERIARFTSGNGYIYPTITLMLMAIVAGSVALVSMPEELETN